MLGRGPWCEAIWMLNQHACFRLQSLLLLQPGLQLGPKHWEQMRGLELGSVAPAPGQNRCTESNVRSLNEGGLEPCQPLLQWSRLMPPMGRLGQCTLEGLRSPCSRPVCGVFERIQTNCWSVSLPQICTSNSCTASKTVARLLSQCFWSHRINCCC